MGLQELTVFRFLFKRRNTDLRKLLLYGIFLFKFFNGTAILTHISTILLQPFLFKISNKSVRF